MKRALPALKGLHWLSSKQYFALLQALHSTGEALLLVSKSPPLNFLLLALLFKMADKRKIVFWAAVLSRVGVITLGLISSYFVTPYDTSASISQVGSDVGSLSIFANWDVPLSIFIVHESKTSQGVYFARVAAAGYEFEQIHAFFPGENEKCLLCKTLYLHRQGSPFVFVL
jgi:hypothetical protein